MDRYGTCDKCGTNLNAIWFIEYESKLVGNSWIKTGRQRRAVSHLCCPECLTNYCVDGSFDGDWWMH